MSQSGRQAHHPFTPERLDRLKCFIISQAFATEVPEDTEAADQLVRTRVHPQLYDTITHLNALLKDGGSDFVRRVADRMGYSSVTMLFPQVRPVMIAYQNEEGDSEVLSEAFREIVCFAAFFRKDILDQLFTSVYSTQVNRVLQKRYHDITRRSVSPELFFTEHDTIRDQADREKFHNADPVLITPIHPLHVRVKESGEYYDYTIPAHLRLFDSIHRCFDIHIEDPVVRDRFDVEQQISIPWDRIADGLLVQIELVHSESMVHPSERIFLSNADLRAMRARGSAVPTKIGRFSEIRLYPEYFSSVFSSDAKFPQHPIGSIRTNLASVEIRRLDHSVQLTVFV